MSKQFTKPILTTLTVALQTLKDNRWKKCNILCKNNTPNNHIKTIENILKNFREQGLAKDGYSPANVLAIHIGAIQKNKTSTMPFDCSSFEIEKIHDVLIENVKIHKMTTDTKTIEGIRDKNNNLLMAGNIGVIRWIDISPAINLIQTN